MGPHPLTPLFNPRSIAVIGASRSEGSVGNRVFQNLIDNAAKFQQGKGWIAVRGGETKEGWCFSVADNGPGIEPEHQQRIFGIFQTVYSRDQFETTGVGLAVVRKAVERMGGRVWVESEPGSGSTFHFTLAKTQPLVTKMDASLS